MILAKMARPCRGATTLYRPWTKAEESILRRGYRTVGMEELAASLGRSPRALQNRAKALKLFRRPRRWSDIEDRRLRNALDEVGLAWAARRIGRTARAAYERAVRIGIPVGRPPGYESVSAAAQRTGYDFATIVRILEWAGVKIRHALSQPNATRMPRRLQRMVETIDVDDAVALWMSTETPYAAGKRFGCDDRTIVQALLSSGLKLPPRPAVGHHWRIPSETIDSAMTRRSERAL